MNAKFRKMTINGNPIEGARANILAEVKMFLASYQGARTLLRWGLPHYIEDPLDGAQWVEVAAQLIISTDPPFASTRAGRPVRIVKRFFATIQTSHEVGDDGKADE